MSDTKEQPLLLKDLIRQVRNELIGAVDERKRKNEPGMFAVKSLTLEVNFTVEKNVKSDAGGEANFWIFKVNAGGEGSRRSEQVHKITLELTPSRSLPDIEPFLVESSGSPGIPTVTELTKEIMLLSNPHKIKDFSGMSAELKTAIKKMNRSPLEKYAGNYSVLIPKSGFKKKK